MIDSDEFETSIHDLDHAPAPPKERSLGAGTSPPPLARGAGRRRLWSTDSAQSMPPPPSILPDLPPVVRRHSLSVPADTVVPKKHVGFAPEPSRRHSLSENQQGMMKIHESQVWQEPFEKEVTEQEEIDRYGYEDMEGFKPRLRAGSSGSMWSETSGEKLSTQVDQDDEENHDEDMTSLALDDSRQARTCCGYYVPLWFPTAPTSLDTATTIVNYAPCFCCIPIKQRTDRVILKRLNVLMVLFCLVQLGIATFLSVVLYAPHLLDRNVDPNQLPMPTLSGGKQAVLESFMTNLWTSNGSILLLGLLGLVLLVATGVSWNRLQNVDLVGAIRFSWVIAYVLPFQLFSVIGLFDTFKVTWVFLVHYWRSVELAYFRLKTCSPSWDYNTLCTPPIGINETYWCELNYNATNCGAMRDSAQVATHTILTFTYYVSAAFGMALILLLLLIRNTLEHIISKPLVEKSRQSNYFAWLTLPCAGCLALGLILTESELTFGKVNLTSSNDRDFEINWIGPLFIACGCMFFVGACLVSYSSSFSIMRTSDKRRKLFALTVFVVLMLSSIVMLAVLFGFSVAISLALKQYPISDEIRGRYACFLDQTQGCTRCDEPYGRCPEWSKNDVISVLQSQAKTAATLAAIFILYSFGSVKHGFTMRKHISMYQIDYV